MVESAEGLVQCGALQGAGGRRKATAPGANAAPLLAGVGFGAWPDAQRVAALAAPAELVANPGSAADAYQDSYLRYRQLYLPIAAALT